MLSKEDAERGKRGMDKRKRTDCGGIRGERIRGV